MKVILLVSVACLSLVLQGDCGVIDNVYGRIKNRTVEFKDDVSSMWNGAKDIVFGTDEEKAPEVTTRVQVKKEDDGVFGSICHGVMNIFQSARQKIRDVVFGDSDTKKSSLIGGLYNRISNRVIQLKSFVFGDNKSVEATKPVRDAVNKFLEIEIEKSNAALNAVKKRISDLDHKVRKEGDNVSNGVGVIGEKVKNEFNINDMSAAGDFIRQQSSNVQDNLGSSIDKLQENLKDLTETERKVLNDISNRIHNRMINETNAWKSQEIA